MKMCMNPTCSKRNATLLLLFGYIVESDRDILQFGGEGGQGRDMTYPTHLNRAQCQLLHQGRPVLNKAVSSIEPITHIITHITHKILNLYREQIKPGHLVEDFIYSRGICPNNNGIKIRRH